MSDTDPRLLCLSDKDNILVLTQTVQAGETILVNGQKVENQKTLGLGHKLAARLIPSQDDILKYGMPIGFARHDIQLGEHIHVHNLISRHTPVEIME